MAWAQWHYKPSKPMGQAGGQGIRRRRHVPVESEVNEQRTIHPRSHRLRLPGPLRALPRPALTWLWRIQRGLFM